MAATISYYEIEQILCRITQGKKGAFTEEIFHSKNKKIKFGIIIIKDIS